MKPIEQDADLDTEAMQARFEAALARSKEIPESLGGDDLLTLVLPPFWQEPLLQKVVGTHAAVEELLAKAGRMVQTQGRTGARSIALVDPDNAALIGRVRQTSGLHERASELGERLTKAAGGSLSPILSHWVDLAQQLKTHGDYELARTLVADVGRACAEGRPGSVQDRVEAAAVLARSFGPPLSGAVRVAQHRIQHWYRVKRDERKLEYFVQRAPALAAFDSLRTGPESLWALHYVGVGGTGKTSLIRYLATRVATEQGLQLARIDFDHLSPAYPARDPGQLISTLLYELTALVETERQDKFLGFIDDALERMKGIPLPVSSNVRDILDMPAVQELTSWFGSLLQSFPRPTFVFDTCEELTKLQVTDGVIPSVEATFLLLERLHEQANQLRVVFAGRRLLAAGYANWEPPMGAARVGGVATRRDYMCLHELRGFDEAEARSYLAKRLPAARRADEPLVGKLLALSPEPLRVQVLATKDEDGPPHFNPFDLNRYADWADAVPDVAVESFDAATIDPYVEVRIIQRMGQLDALLPAVALLRRFDVSMLAHALPPGSDPRPTFDELARHEWLRISDIAGRTVLEVDRGLPARIETCLAANRAAELQRVHHDLGESLRARIESSKLPDISVEVYDGALRLLPPDHAEELWRSIELRIGEEAGWTWMSELTHDLIAEGYAGEHSDNLVGAAIRATHASAMIHAGARSEVETLWREVEHGATIALDRAGFLANSDTVGHRRSVGSSPAWLLRQRARLGIVAAQAYNEVAADANSLAETVASVGEELTRWGHTHALDSSMCAALEALVERAERTPDVPAIGLGALVDLTKFQVPGLSAFGADLAERIAILAAHKGIAVTVGESDAAPPKVIPDLPATTLDWRPPESLCDRLRLEYLRRRRFLDGASDYIDDWMGWADPQTTDGDRLIAALVLHPAAKAAPPHKPRYVEVGTRSERVAWVGEERCAAHRAFPPFAYALARSALTEGQFALARGLIGELPAPWSARLACETARWTRLSKDLDALGGTQSLDERSAREVASARAIVEGSSSRGKLDPVASWSSQSARTREDTESLVDLLRDHVPDLVKVVASPRPPVESARASLLLEELVALSRYTNEPIVPQPTAPAPRVEAVHPDLREEAIRLGFRAYAIDNARTYTGPTTSTTLTLAIEEAELMDLRLPTVALRLFAWVAREAKIHEIAPIQRRALLGAMLAAQHAGDASAFDRHWRTWMRDVVPADQPEGYEALVMRLLEEDLSKRGTGRPGSGLTTIPPGAGSTPPSVLVRTYRRGAEIRPTYVARARAWLKREGFAGTMTAVIIMAIVASLIWGLIWVAKRISGALPFSDPWSQIAAYTAIVSVLTALQKSGHALSLAKELVLGIGSALGRRRSPHTHATVLITELSRDQAEIVIEAEPPIAGTIRGEATVSLPGVWPKLASSELAPALVALSRRAPPVTVTLDPDPSLGARCWEGVLYSLDRRLPEAIEFLRIVPGRIATRGDPGPIQIVAGASIIPTLTGAWGGRRGVVHIRRRFRRSYRGDVFATIDFSRDVGDTRWDFDELPLEGARLVVVQCDPIAGEAILTRAEVAEPELAREFLIGALRRTGACGVIVPPVPFPISIEVVEVLAREVGDGGRTDLIAAVHAVRTFLRKEGQDHLAHEVTLFLRDDQPD